MPLSITNPLHKLGENQTITKLANLAIEARRIELLDRRLSQPDPYAPIPGGGQTMESKRRGLQEKRSLEKDIYGDLNIVRHGITEEVKDSIRIIDLDYSGTDEGIRTLTLPFIPKDLEINPDSNFVTIKPMGANNPKYHFTGSEDKIEFEIDWHSFDANRDDVIKNCRLIEALSKADGYQNPPHRVMLMWGNENVLFRDMVFIVLSSPYKLTHFNKAQVRQHSFKMTALLPTQATQKVTLARVTSYNLLSKDIQQVSSTKYY